MIRIEKKKAYLSLYLFVFIFMPPFLPQINILYILDVFAFVALVLKYQNEYRIIKNNRLIKSFSLSYGLFSAMAIVRNIIDWQFFNRLEFNEYFVNIYRLLGVGILIYVCAIYVACYCYRNEIDFLSLCKCILEAGMIEAFFTVIMLLSPAVKNFFNNLFVMNVYGSWESASIASWTLKERLFGFANVLYDGFGYGTGLIAGIAFWVMLEDKFEIKKIFYFLILLVVPTVNALTGFFIAIIAIMLKGLQIFKQRGMKKTAFLSIFLVGISGVAGALVLRGRAADSIRRLEDNLLAILGKNNGITSYNNLRRSSYWTMPQSLAAKLFGTGHSVYTTTKFTHSDTGYTNMIWMVGIIGCIWLYLSFIIPLMKEYKIVRTPFIKGVLVFMAISFMFFEIKGVGVAINTGIPIILSLMFLCAIEINKKEEAVIDNG